RHGTRHYYGVFDGHPVLTTEAPDALESAPSIQPPGRDIASAHLEHRLARMSLRSPVQGGAKQCCRDAAPARIRPDRNVINMELIGDLPRHKEADYRLRLICA